VTVGADVLPLLSVLFAAQHRRQRMSLKEVGELAFAKTAEIRKGRVIEKEQ
jgi:hypothetical protein